MGDTIERAVQMAIGGFLKLAPAAADVDPSTPLGPTRRAPTRSAAARRGAGRSMDALLAAYRVGARVGWRELARAAAEAGLPATTMAEFAELLFAYIDELSAASVAGHTDELATTSGRVRERYRERLGQRLLAGAAADVLTAAAERAEWAPPASLTAVLLPAAQVTGCSASLGHRHAAGRRGPARLGQLGRRAAVRAAAGARRRRAAAGDTCCGCSTDGRPWSVRRGPGQTSARRTTARCGRWLSSRRPGTADPVDTEDHLVDLVVSADPEALADLRARVLAPLAELGDRPPGNGWPRRCCAGCCTRAAATRSRPRCTCTPRPSATGCSRCASCTATASATRRWCVKLVIALSASSSTSGVTTQPAVTGARAGRAGRASRGRVRIRAGVMSSSCRGRVFSLGCSRVAT